MRRSLWLILLVFGVGAVACSGDPPGRGTADVRDTGPDMSSPLDAASRDVTTDSASMATEISFPDGADAREVDIADDAGGTETGDGSAEAGDPEGRCASEGERLRCEFRTATLLEEAEGATSRRVRWQVPTGEPPADGWPVTVVFQGAYTDAESTWEAEPEDPYGHYHKVRTVRALLDSGIAVLAPEPLGDGSGYWQTNVQPYASNWESSDDHELMLALFEALEAERFGPVDLDRLYAAGFSSGGYMTSRMAVAYTARFDALAIHSGSYAHCSSSACWVPDEMPDAHPPTLFLHGENDPTVPIWTMREYLEQLNEQEIRAETLVDDSGGHAWMSEAPDAIPQWFHGRTVDSD